MCFVELEQETKTSQMHQSASKCQIVTGSFDKTAKLWDANTGQSGSQFDAFLVLEDSVTQLAGQRGAFTPSRATTRRLSVLPSMYRSLGASLGALHG